MEVGVVIKLSLFFFYYLSSVADNLHQKLRIEGKLHFLSYSGNLCVTDSEEREIPKNLSTF